MQKSLNVARNTIPLALEAVVVTVLYVGSIVGFVYAAAWTGFIA